jgi:hypothetical protein
MGKYREYLEGTWMLDFFTGTDEAGQSTHILGEGATGFISYSGDGWVSVEIIGTDRPRYTIPDVSGGTDEQTLACARTIFAYAGRYEIDEENGIVYHNIEFSLIPNWIGSRQKRYINEESETEMSLTADPVRMGKEGKVLRSRLRWIKLKKEI